MVHGYHKYQSIRDIYNPLTDGDLPSELEMGNSPDPQAVDIKKVTMVRLVPYKLLGT